MYFTKDVIKYILSSYIIFLFARLQRVYFQGVNDVFIQLRLDSLAGQTERKDAGTLALSCPFLSGKRAKLFSWICLLTSALD